MQRIKITKEEIENLLKLNISIKEIGEKLNVHGDTIFRRIKEYGIIKPEKTKDKRICQNCKIEHPLTNDWFYNDKGDWLGFQKTCKNCQNERSKIYRENNRDYFIQKGKDKYKKEDNPAR